MKVVNNKEDKVDFETLNEGDCYRDEDGDIYIKTDFEQDAVNLATGVVYSGQCGQMVTPVDAEVQIID